MTEASSSHGRTQGPQQGETFCPLAHHCVLLFVCWCTLQGHGPAGIFQEPDRGAPVSYLPACACTNLLSP